MTDNEIIKALECCSDNKCITCHLEFIPTCRKKILSETIALINRQKAEIERLEELVYLADSETANVRDLYFEEKSERAEAIKEFAERLKDYRVYVEDFDGEMVEWVDIDNLVKEMVGADNDR